MSDSVRVTPETLARWLAQERCVVFDCRFNLAEPDAGRSAWLEGHIPGSVYAHLDNDLAGPVTSASGRHPLPAPESFAEFLGRSGWQPGKLAVAYDGGGGMIAARFWWLMKYFGLDGAYLLDGGLAAWREASLPLEEGASDVVSCDPPDVFPRHDLVMSVHDVERALHSGEIALLDARAEGRFRGDYEPLDSGAGHVPGALNFPCEHNLEDGRLKSAADLREAYEAVLPAGVPVVHMCGSGVTACFNVLAMEEAGHTGARVYVGSWSEWIRDPRRPVATGD